MQRLLSFIPRLWSNWISLLGTVITTLSGLSLVLMLVFDLVAPDSNPYANAVLILTLPGVFIVGLLLIPLGFWVARRRSPERAAEEEGLESSFREMLKKPVVRRRILFVIVATLVNVVLVAAAGHKSVTYMGTPGFCGTTCHTVMQPQYEAYQRSPHSRVACVDCHIGPGASWAVKSKIDGLRQVVAVMADTYPRPITGPIHSLRPARDTCEHCHWPAKFHGNRLSFFDHFADDEASTPNTTAVLLKIGGEDPKTGKIGGIHWHVDPGLEVRYEALDDKREKIGKVTVVRDGEVVAEYLPPKDEGEVHETRSMDCVDCHNRPTHVFDGPPALAVDKAMADGRLEAKLPFLKKAAVEVLAKESPDRDGAEPALREALAAFYAKEFPDAKVAPPELDKAAAGLADLYRRNVFPEMKVTWDTYPSHLGHRGAEGDMRGCFRCHDDLHKTSDGKVIRQDCDLCHEILEEEVAPDALPDALKALRLSRQ